MTTSTPAPAQRAPFTHRLKCWPKFFGDILTGRLRFNIRRDDRSPPFQPGDFVEFYEWDPTGVDDVIGGVAGYTNRKALYVVGYVLREKELPFLGTGWCAFDLISVEDYQRVALAIRGER